MSLRRFAGRIFAACILLLCSSLPCSAVLKVWDGEGDGVHWGDGANWHENGVPAPIDDADIGDAGWEC